MQAMTAQPQPEGPRADDVPCACVHSDATTCARIRDGFACDDFHWDHRECECSCHESNEDDEEATP